MELKIEANTPVRFEDKVAMVPGEVTRERIVKNEGGSVSVLAFDKDAVIEHKSPSVEIVSVIEGSVKIIIDAKEHVLKVGDHLLMLPDTAHKAVALEPSRIVMVRLHTAATIGK